MNNTKKGMFCILCAAFFFASMNVCVKLAGNLPSIQKSFFRNLIPALFALIILLKNKEEISIEEHMEIYEKQGISRKDAMKQVAKDRGVSKRDIYSYLMK